MTKLQLTRPDDWHIHLRDGSALARTVADASAQFSRAVVMPNLKPPVTTVEAALAYRERILAANPHPDFNPLMALYLTDATSAEMVATAASNEHVIGYKLYPAGATTNSDDGVTDLENAFDAIEAMAEHGVPLLIHGEVTRSEVDIFDREKVFIEESLAPLLERFPNLKVVLEHITTKDAVDFVSEHAGQLGATITAHHLLINRNHMLVGGIRPHYYCLPIVKRELHQRALIEAATSGKPGFFLGTDSAPHARHTKESDCGCAGVYTAHAAIELYAEAFEAAGALDKLEGFASQHGPDFYGLPRNTQTITLTRAEHRVASHLPLGDEALVPFRAGETVKWQIQS